MKGLLLKDLFVLKKQMWIFSVLIGVFLLFPIGNNGLFSLVFAGMLPITALAYDEQSKWNKLAAMMPYSTKDIVLSKYLLGLLLIGGVALLFALRTVLLQLLRLHTEGYQTSAPAMLTVACIAILLLSLNLPFMFRFGTEKGRLIFILCVAVCTVWIGVFHSGEQDALFGMGETVSTASVLLPFVLLTAVALPVSILCSVRLYERNKG